MLAIHHESIAMPSCQLLLARVAVINKNDETTPVTEDLGDTRHPPQRCQRRLHALSCFRMNTVAIQKFVLGSGRRLEGFYESAVGDSHPHRTAIIDDLDQQRIEE